MLCRTCQASIKTACEGPKLPFLRDENHQISNVLHDSVMSFDQSLKEGCVICWQLLEFSLEHGHSFSEYEEISLGDEGDSEDENEVAIKVLEKCWDSALNLPLFEVSNGTVGITISPISTNKADPDAFMRSGLAGESASMAGNPELWRYWFRTCSEAQVKCRELSHQLEPFAPDRQIEILTDDNGSSFSWRLVFRTDIGNVPYLTLSHCWGLSQHICLTSKNYSACLEFNSYSKLPKTFRHAFFITFSLGLRFIWIDSLCIIQDDLGDWKTQASMMGSVYKNACCNIAATRAADSNGGCFRTREPTKVMLDFGLGQLAGYQVSLATLYYEDLLHAPLNRRGWVAQERFLARNQLSFAESQVYWECRELVASEQFPRGIPERLRDFSPYNQALLPTGKPTLHLTTEVDLREAWAALVDFYSDCAFTRLSDKIIALPGLAEEMREIINDVYLVGLWKNDLHRQLCWATDCDVRIRTNRFVTPTYLVPTWSWVNVNGLVMSDMLYYRDDLADMFFIEVLDVFVYSEHFSNLHSFVSSKFILRGIAVWAKAVPKNKVAGLESDDWELELVVPSEISHSCRMTGIRASILWDENMHCSEVDLERWPSFLEERTSNLLFMFVSVQCDNDYITGLVLRRLPRVTAEDVYVRMGIFTDYSKVLSEFLSVRLENPSNVPFGGNINLGDVKLVDIVHTVTII